MRDLKSLFKKPSTWYRGAPFWSWNDRLEVDELVRQVHDMKAHGMGGFFMHSREGLETVYMGSHWLTCIRETVDAAAEAGTYAWLYDEDRWPSGAAGGLVPARGGDAYRAKRLAMVEVDVYEPAEDVLALFRAEVEDHSVRRVARIATDAGAEAAEGETLLAFRREIADMSERYNDDAPPDNLNPESVAAFIDITYEAYADEVGDAFGDTIPGIFTDEPNIAGASIGAEHPWVPWTDGLDAYFAARRGYDLLDVIPYLFLDGESSTKTRHDYWWTVSERYTEAYSKQIGAWCDAHGLAFTGHYLAENQLGSGIVRGGAIMPHYQYQAVPGIDMLMVQTHENLTVKQCTSVAHQFERERVLSETYGCSGWEMTFEEQKWVGDWQYVLGVNLRCQHLALYTLRGCRKRDYPPAFNYNTTWWKYNGVVEDYFARVGLLTTAGEVIRDVLVLHPTATGWSMVGDAGDFSGGVKRADAYGETVNAFTRAVLATHYDFDFGDEQIMATHGRVEDATLWVNAAPYKVVVIPPGTTTMLASTFELLQQFVDAGGRVIAFEPVPMQMEAVDSVALTSFFARSDVTVLRDIEALERALESSTSRRISIRDQHGAELNRFLAMQRELDDGRQVFFIVNNDPNNAYRTYLTFEGVGRVESWDLLSGEVAPVPVTVLQAGVRFEADFDSAGSRMYVMDREHPPVVNEQALAMRAGRSEPRRFSFSAFIGPVCDFRRTDPNLLTLDVCRYRMKSEGWSEPMTVWKAQNAIRDALDMRAIYYNGLPQRYQWVDEPHPNDGTPVAFQFTFNVHDVPTTPVFLVVEGAEDYTITLNDEPVSNERVGWYLDRSFAKVALPALEPGINTLTLATDYENRMEVEDCFILGDFGVDVQRAIVREPETLHFGDWCLQGYFHYAGSMVYLDTLTHESDETLILTLGSVSAVDVAIHVNGEVVGHIPWQDANDFDLTPYLNEGENEIGIEVVSSPRNMLGPLHRKAGYEAWTDSRSFRREGEAYTPEYVVWPWGLMGQVRIRRA
jgi:hypothetical protein